MKVTIKNSNFYTLASNLPPAGDESGVMLDAHTEAGFIVGLPFAAEGLYDFAAHGDSTRRVANLGAVMLQVRCPHARPPAFPEPLYVPPSSLQDLLHVSSRMT